MQWKLFVGDEISSMTTKNTESVMAEPFLETCKRVTNCFRSNYLEDLEKNGKRYTVSQESVHREF